MYRSLRLPLPLLLALCFAVGAGGLARAQDAPQSESASSELQEVVVTAQKRAEKLHDVPMGVSAVTGEDLDKEQILDFADLESKVPGLSVELIAPGQDRLTLRGENVGGVGSTVTTYLDDTPFGSSNALANGSINAGDFDTWDLQRIEVLRGPQGTLYGAGAEGGLLKYVTNPPDPSTFAGALQVGDEDIAHGGDGASVKGMVNIPVGSIAAFRVDGSDTRLPGYIDDPQLAEQDVNRGYQSDARAAFLLQPNEHFSITLRAFGQDLHTDGTPYVDVVGAGLTPLTPPPNQLDPNHGAYDQDRFIGEPSSYLYRIYSAEINWNAGWATATSVTSYGTTAQNLFTDATSTVLAPGVTFGDLGELLTGAPTGVGEVSDLLVKKFTQEVRLASPAQLLEWQVGAFYTRESSTLQQVLPTFGVPDDTFTALPPLETADLDALYREWSAFGQLDYHILQQFDVAFGGRWSENKQSANETIGGLLVAPPELVSGDSTGTDFTYSVAPRWHLNPDTMLYARVASGYRPGGPNPLPPGAPAGVPHEYEADTTVNYEFGIRSSLLDNQVSIDLSAFLIDWHKIQLLEIVEDFGIDANGGTARSKGLEWTLGYTPVKGLNFTLTGAYVDAYLTAPAPDAGGNTGDPLPYVPKWSTSFDAQYQWHAFGSFDALAGATSSYIGSRYDDFSTSSAVVGGAVVSVPNPRAQLGGYNTFDLRLGLENPHWLFDLYCKNVADVRGITYYLYQGTPDFGGSIGVAQPRTVGAQLTYRF